MILQTTEALQKEGHEVVSFAMQHPDNWFSEWSDYFVSNVDYKGAKYGPIRLVSEALRIIYSTEARNKIQSLIDKTHPDLAHLHNIYHQISPSILPSLKKAGIATVLTLHDGKLVCPAEHFFVDGEVCERCRGRYFINCFKHKCIKQSRAKSLVCTLEMYIHRLTSIYTRNVDLFIAPSEFYRQKVVEAGIASPDRVVKIFNAVDVDSIEPSAPGNYALYLGRMDRHKGVLTLIEAMRQCPDVQLKMVGTGDALDECVRLVTDNGLKNVQILGFMTGECLSKVIRESAFLIVPSEWYENCPMVVIEAAAHGKPAIVTRIGGIPELVEDGLTGFIVDPRDPTALATRIRQLGRESALTRMMGARARTMAEREFSLSVYYRRLTEAYNVAIDYSRNKPTA